MEAQDKTTEYSRGPFEQLVIEQLSSLKDEVKGMNQSVVSTLIEFSGLTQSIQELTRDNTSKAIQIKESKDDIAMLKTAKSNFIVAVAVFSSLWMIIGSVTVYAFKIYMTNLEAKVSANSAQQAVDRIKPLLDQYIKKK